MNAEPRTGELVLTYRGMVYPQHLDHIGHMNIHRYVAKFDQAAWHLFDRIGMTSDYCRENDRGMAAVEMVARYLKELCAGNLLNGRSGLLSVDEKSLRLVQEMRLGEARGVGRGHARAGSPPGPGRAPRRAPARGDRRTRPRAPGRAPGGLR